MVSLVINFLLLLCNPLPLYEPPTYGMEYLTTQTENKTLAVIVHRGRYLTIRRYDKNWSGQGFQRDDGAFNVDWYDRNGKKVSHGVYWWEKEMLYGRIYLPDGSQIADHYMLRKQ